MLYRNSTGSLNELTDQKAKPHGMAAGRARGNMAWNVRKAEMRGCL